jgi:hypothetical protein
VVVVQAEQAGAEPGERWVDEGDLIFMPPDTIHSIEDRSSEVLTADSAAFYDAVQD